MKKIINATAAIFVMLLAFNTVQASEIISSDCFGECSFGDFFSNNYIFEPGQRKNFDLLFKANEANKKRIDLAEAKITYGWLGIGAGSAKIYLTVKDGKLVDLNIDAKVGMLGMNEDINQKITIDQLKTGTALEFTMDGSTQPSLRVRPKAGFNERGGAATLEIWDGKKYRKETIIVHAPSGDDYRLYQNKVARTNEVTGITINMRGYSIAGMHVDNYKIQTR